MDFKILESVYIPVLKTKLPTKVEYRSEEYEPFDEKIVNHFLTLDEESLWEYLNVLREHEKLSIEFWDLSYCLYGEMRNIEHPDLTDYDNPYLQNYLEQMEYNHELEPYTRVRIFSIDEVLKFNDEELMEVS
tara:strand:+ start:1565 stop:1960 length:396 start_codon:yes stop_codon:yes gene_type:complete